VPLWLSGLLAALLPPLVLLAGVAIMGATPQHQMIQSVKPLGPLNAQPYDAAYATAYWTALADKPGVNNATALESERFLLKIDLLFPLFYGGALAVGLYVSGRALGYAGLWTLLVPVLLMMAADWTENVVQLEQIRVARIAPSSFWIGLASIATCLKLALVSGLTMLNIGAGLLLVCRAIRS
jgi:hypothetical protein